MAADQSARHSSRARASRRVTMRPKLLALTVLAVVAGPPPSCGRALPRPEGPIKIGTGVAERAAGHSRDMINGFEIAPRKASTGWPAMRSSSSSRTTRASRPPNSPRSADSWKGRASTWSGAARRRRRLCGGAVHRLEESSGHFPHRGRRRSHPAQAEARTSSASAGRSRPSRRSRQGDYHTTIPTQVIQAHRRHRLRLVFGWEVAAGFQRTFEEAGG